MNKFFRTAHQAMILGLALPILSGCSAGESSAPEDGKNQPEPVEEASRFDPSLSDPKAIEIARATYESMGGEEGFEKAALITFRFVVEKDGIPSSDYEHVWDRKTGRYRLSGTQKDGKGFIAFFNVNDFSAGKPDQDVYISGRRLDDFESANHLNWMYGRFINDTYWILMPAKLLDPGVILKYEGESTDSNGQIHDIILASFQEGTGLTWQDRYWVYINRETHLMDRWEYILMGSPEDEPRGVATWTEWTQHGALVLSTVRDFPDKPFRIRIADLQVSETVSEDLFKRPTK
ncbi:MAG: hypothetical protein V3T95_05525 [Acidobacteriota bacterium]